MTDPDRHKTRMAKKKAIVDARIARAREERGVLILLKGAGKGKSSSAFGTLARSAGHGQKCAVIQFIKGRMETGELDIEGFLDDFGDEMYEIAENDREFINGGKP